MQISQSATSHGYSTLCDNGDCKCSRFASMHELLIRAQFSHNMSR